MTENMTSGAVSQNGWSVITQSYVRQWTVGGRAIPVRRGVAGFCLIHLAWWFDARVEPLVPSYDDWGWALRRIGGTDLWSNHASGTAIDLNADAHPQGKWNTFSAADAEKIRERLARKYHGLIKWGGDFHAIPDEMHYEIQGTYTEVTALARELADTEIGRAMK